MLRTTEIVIDVYADLDSQIADILNKVEAAKAEGERIRLVRYRRQSLDHANATSEVAKISDAVIKALVYRLEIDEYAIKEHFSHEKAMVQFTYDDLNKKDESNFFTRNWYKFTAAVGIPTAAAGVLGGIFLAGFAASWLGGPVGAAAYLLAAAIVAVPALVIGSIIASAVYSYKSGKEAVELAQHCEDIAQELKTVNDAIQTVKSRAVKAKGVADEKASQAARAVAEKINDIKKFPADCISEEAGKELDGEQIRATGDVAVRLAEIRFKVIKQAAAEAYINNNFNKLQADLTTNLELPLLDKEKSKQVIGELKTEIEDKRTALLSQVADWINRKMPSDNIMKKVNDAYKHQFAQRLAAVINHALYAGNGVTFRKELESDPLALEACDKVLAKYEEQARVKVNALASEFEKIAIADLPAREQQEKEAAAAFNKQMNEELDAMLEPDALQAAREAKTKADLQEAFQTIEAIQPMIDALKASSPISPPAPAAIEKKAEKEKGFGSFLGAVFGAGRSKDKSASVTGKPGSSAPGFNNQ